MKTTPINYAEYLNEILNLRKQKNPKYSSRAMARDIGVDASDLINILNGKKKITTKIAYKAGLHFGLEDKELLAFIAPTLEK